MRELRRSWGALGKLCCGIAAAACGGSENGAGDAAALGEADALNGASPGNANEDAGFAGATAASGQDGLGGASQVARDNAGGSAGADGLTAGGAAGAGVDGGAGEQQAVAPRSGFPAVDAIDRNGPFVTNNPLGEAAGPSCIIHRPATLGEGGLRHPVIVWGMGTGGFNTYGPSFDLWASHGFIVAAATLGNGQGDGVEMLACLDYACEAFAAHVDCHAGASGHSQGGAGAIMTGRDPRVIATAPVQPYTEQGFGGFDTASIASQVGPMLLLSGTNDNIATPSLYQQPVFTGTNVPVFWANLVGGDHVVTGTDGAASYKGVILAWFRLQLMGDQDFRPMFYAPDCSLCSDGGWQVMPSAGL